MLGSSSDQIHLRGSVRVTGDWAAAPALFALALRGPEINCGDDGK